MKKVEIVEPDCSDLVTSSIMLSPKAKFQSSQITIVFSQIRIGLNLFNDKFRNNDIWSLDGQLFYLTKSTLDQIAKAAGVSYLESSLIRREIGEDKRVTFVKHSIKYKYLSEDGTEITSCTTGEYSYFEDLASIKYREDVYKESVLTHRKDEPILDLIEIRRLRSGSVAEANAKRNALGEIFSRLKKPFTLEELKNPIIVGKVVFDKETILKENPEFKPAYIGKMLGLSNMIYNVNPVNNHAISQDSIINFPTISKDRLSKTSFSDSYDKSHLTINQRNNYENS